MTPVAELERFLDVIFEKPGTDPGTMMRHSLTLLQRSPLAHRAYVTARGVIVRMRSVSPEDEVLIERAEIEQASRALLSLFELFGEEGATTLSHRILNGAAWSRSPLPKIIAFDPKNEREVGVFADPQPGYFVGIDMGTGAALTVQHDGLVRPKKLVPVPHGGSGIWCPRDMAEKIRRYEVAVGCNPRDGTQEAT